MIRAVIFDFDGVMTSDTIRISQGELKQILGKRGISFEDEQLCLLEGKHITQIIADLMGKPIDDPEVQEVDREKLKMFREDREKIKIEEKALHLVKTLKKKGMKVAVASGSRKENLKAILGNDYTIFDIITTCEDVKKYKPHPQPYLTTAEKLGVKPSECIAIENAPLGIESAKKAGMTCIAITTTLPPKHLEEADTIVDNYQQLEQAIESHLNKEVKR